MDHIEQLKEILSWHASQKHDVSSLAIQNNRELLNTVEELIGEELPSEFIDLYSLYNGDVGDGEGTFLGHGIESLESVISTLKIAISCIKPSNPKVTNPNEAKKIMDKIASEMEVIKPKQKLWGLLGKNGKRLNLILAPIHLVVFTYITSKIKEIEKY